MSEENKTLARHSWEIISQRNPDTLEEVYAADALLYEPDQDLEGLEAAKQFLSPYLSAFPDQTVTVEDVMAEGDKACRMTRRAAADAGSGCASA
jgi:ketosteroid isomerase-like protein